MGQTDLLLVHGMRFMFQVAVALIKLSEEELVHTEGFEEILSHLQRTVPALASDTDRVISTALAIGIDDTRLAALEEEFHKIQQQAFVYGNGDDNLTRMFAFDPVLSEIRDILTEQRKTCAALKKTSDFLQQQVNHARSALNTMRLENDASHTALAIAGHENTALVARNKALELELEQLREELLAMKRHQHDQVSVAGIASSDSVPVIEISEAAESVTDRDRVSDEVHVA